MNKKAEEDDHIEIEDEYDIALEADVEDESLLENPSDITFSITSYGADYTVDSIIARLGALVVLLAHSRTDTRWFHDWVYGKAHEIRFVRGRLKFGDGHQSAPFPSMIAVFLPQCAQPSQSKSTHGT